PRDEVGQLTHVSRPGMPPKRLERLARDDLDVSIHRTGELSHEEPDKRRNVLGSLTQRGDVDGKDVVSTFRQRAGLSARSAATRALACLPTRSRWPDVRPGAATSRTARSAKPAEKANRPDGTSALTREAAVSPAICPEQLQVLHEIVLLVVRADKNLKGAFCGAFVGTMPRTGSRTSSFAPPSPRFV